MPEPRLLRHGIGDADVTLYMPGAAAGAIANGAAIVKARWEPGDATPVGAPGVVLASHAVTDEMRESLRGQLAEMPSFFYFVEWDAQPGVAVAVSDWKIAPAPE